MRLRFPAFAGMTLSALLAACSPLRVLNATVASDGVRVTRDLAYGAGPAHRLDVYQPPPGIGGEHPLVVFFFGGSWKNGDKAGYRFVGTALAKRGMVVVIPNYRLYPSTMFPGFLKDGAAAVAWAVAHAAEFDASPHPVLIGHSAGAYIAIMLAVDPAYLDAAGPPPNPLPQRDGGLPYNRLPQREGGLPYEIPPPLAGGGRGRGLATQIAGAVGIAGPYDFHPAKLPDIAPIFAGYPRSETQPIFFADGTNKPILLLAGADDTTVRPRNTTALAARIEDHHGPVSVRIYPDLGHIGILVAFAPLFAGKAPVVADVTRFVDAISSP